MMNKSNIFLGVIILIYIIYNRLFRVRNEKSFYVEITYIKLLCYICLFVIAFIFIAKNIVIIYKCFFHDKNKKKIDNIILLKIINLYNNPRNPIFYWKKSLIELDIYIKNNLPFYDDHKSYGDLIIEKTSTIIIQHKRFSLIILFTIIICCQAIVIASLLVDTLFLCKFYYFYKTLWVLIFPLIISYIIYSIKTFAETNIESLDNVIEFNIAPNNNTHDTLNYRTININEWYSLLNSQYIDQYICCNTLKSAFLSNAKHIDQAYTLNYCLDSLNIYFGVRFFIETYEYHETKSLAYYNVIKYAAYAICWANISYIVGIEYLSLNT